MQNRQFKYLLVSLTFDHTSLKVNQFCGISSQEFMLATAITSIRTEPMGPDTDYGWGDQMSWFTRGSPGYGPLSLCPMCVFVTQIVTAICNLDQLKSSVIWNTLKALHTLKGSLQTIASWKRSSPATLRVRKIASEYALCVFYFILTIWSINADIKLPKLSTACEVNVWIQDDLSEKRICLGRMWARNILNSLQNSCRNLVTSLILFA